MEERKINILIVDDEEQIRRLLKKFLVKENYDINEATDGFSAYDELMKNEYELCILDNNMPGLTGLQLLEKVKEENKLGTSFIMITGSDQITTVIDVMRLGIDDYIQKPFDFYELKSVITKVLQKRDNKNYVHAYEDYLKTEVNNKNEEIKLMYQNIINTLAHVIKVRDNYTGDHIETVSQLAVMIGEEMGLERDFIENLRIGGILHDIGKLAMGDDILKKKTKLTTEEYQEIKKHPELGCEIIKKINFLKHVIPCILHHQERFDGNGYPGGLKGKHIPLEGRILAIADAFEAMTSNRPYRKQLSLEKAYDEILNNSGVQFDPDIVKIFCQLWEKGKIKKMMYELVNVNDSQ